MFIKSFDAGRISTILATKNRLLLCIHSAIHVYSSETFQLLSTVNLTAKIIRLVHESEYQLKAFTETGRVVLIDMFDYSIIKEEQVLESKSVKDVLKCDGKSYLILCSDGLYSGANRLVAVPNAAVYKYSPFHDVFAYSENNLLRFYHVGSGKHTEKRFDRKITAISFHSRLLVGDVRGQIFEYLDYNSSVFTKHHWHAHSVLSIHDLAAYEESITGSAVGKRFCSGGEEGVFVLWNPTQFISGLGAHIKSMSVYETNVCLLMNDNSVRLINTTTMRVEGSINGLNCAGVISNNHAYANGSVQVWERGLLQKVIDVERKPRIFRTSAGEFRGETVTTLCVSGENMVVATNESLKLFKKDALVRKIVIDEVNNVRFSTDGTLVVAACNDGFKVFDTEGSLLWSGWYKDSKQCSDVYAHGGILCASFGSVVTVWSCINMCIIKTIAMSVDVKEVAVVKDLVCVLMNNGECKVMNLITNHLLFKGKGEWIKECKDGMVISYRKKLIIISTKASTDDKKGEMVRVLQSPVVIKKCASLKINKDNVAEIVCLSEGCLVTLTTDPDAARSTNATDNMVKIYQEFEMPETKPEVQSTIKTDKMDINTTFIRKQAEFPTDCTAYTPSQLIDNYLDAMLAKCLIVDEQIQSVEQESNETKDEVKEDKVEEKKDIWHSIPVEALALIS